MANPDTINSISIALPIAVDAPFFDGHFPTNPIVPGAYLLARVVEATREHCNHSGPVEVSSAKFLSVVTPGQDITLQFVEQPTALRFSLTVAQQVVVSGSLKLLPGAAP